MAPACCLREVPDELIIDSRVRCVNCKERFIENDTLDTIIAQSTHYLEFFRQLFMHTESRGGTLLCESCIGK